jgi:Matrixin
MRLRSFTVTLACSAMLLALTAAIPAQAAGQSGYVLQKVSADGHLYVIRWNPCQEITYKINLGAVPAKSRASAMKDTKAAMHQLIKYTGLAFSYRGATTEIPTSKNIGSQSAELIIAWIKPSQSDLPLRGVTAGYGGVRYQYAPETFPDGTTHFASPAAIRAIAVIDVPDVLRRIKAGGGKGVNRQNLLMHELGHAVGLQHVLNLHDQMFPALNSHDPKGFGPGDRAGLAKVGAKAGCIEVPEGTDI